MVERDQEVGQGGVGWDLADWGWPEVIMLAGSYVLHAGIIIIVWEYFK